MPEGDTIFRAATSLRRWLEGRELTAARVQPVGAPTRFPNRRAELVGRTVETVSARGKHLLVSFSGPGELVLHTHMGMTGSWHVYSEGDRWRKRADLARVLLTAGPRLAVCFTPKLVALHSAAETERLLAPLGPDVLAADDLSPAVGRARRLGAPTIGELLLDQRVVAGIGNIYRCETLFLCGIHPRTSPTDLSDASLDRLVRTAARLMAANVLPSVAARSFSDGDGGPAHPWVYGQGGRPCRRCATTVRAERLGSQARTVYWCPRCQPAGGRGDASRPGRTGSTPG